MTMDPEANMMIISRPKLPLGPPHPCSRLLTFPIKPQPLRRHPHAKHLLLCLPTCLDAKREGYSLLGDSNCLIASPHAHTTTMQYPRGRPLPASPGLHRSVNALLASLAVSHRLRLRPYSSHPIESSIAGQTPAAARPARPAAVQGRAARDCCYNNQMQKEQAEADPACSAYFQCRWQPATEGYKSSKRAVYRSAT